MFCTPVIASDNENFKHDDRRNDEEGQTIVQNQHTIQVRELTPTIENSNLHKILRELESDYKVTMSNVSKRIKTTNKSKQQKSKKCDVESMPMKKIINLIQ